MRRLLEWILILVLCPIILALVLFMPYALGELTPSVVVCVPFVLLGRDLKDHYLEQSDKTLPTIVGRFFLMPFILLAWLSPVVAFNVLWKTFLFELEGTTTISFFGISIPGVETGPIFDYLAAVCGLAFAGWFVFDAALLMRRRIRMMDQTATTPIRLARAGRCEFTGVARAIEDKSRRKTKVSGKNATATTLEDGIEPILLRRVTKGNPEIVETVLNRFYIEKDGGKIVVDPREASFFEPTEAWPAGREAPHIIILTRRTTEEEVASGRKRTTAALLPGDEIYLFGRAMPDRDEGLVVRPVKAHQSPGILNRFLFNLDREIASHDPRNMFILADGKEALVKQLLERKILHVALFALIWGIPATALLAVLLSRFNP